MSEPKTVTLGGKTVTIEGDVDQVVAHVHRTIRDEQEVRIKLMKMSKGYQWEISTEGPDTLAVINSLETADQQLRQKFGSEE